MRRKNINKFLIELENFIQKHKNKECAMLLHWLDWEPTINSIWRQKKLDLPCIERYINNGTTLKEKNQNSHKTASYVMRLAYSKKFNQTNELSYEHFFNKFLYRNWNLFWFKHKYTAENFLMKNEIKKIYVPRDLFMNFHLYFLDT